MPDGYPLLYGQDGKAGQRGYDQQEQQRRYRGRRHPRAALPCPEPAEDGVGEHGQGPAQEQGQQIRGYHPQGDTQAGGKGRQKGNDMDPLGPMPVVILRHR